MTYDFYPLANGDQQPGQIIPRWQRISALEVAILVEAKHFLAHPMVNRVLQDIWDGSILFQSSMHKLHRTRNLTSEALISSSYGRRGPGVRYRYQDASIFKLSRLRVPRYRHIINLASFVVLLILYVSVLHTRSKVFSTVECVFWLWGLGFVLDEIVAFNDAGFTLYVMSLWNMFDLIILLLIVSYVILRLFCFWFRENGYYDYYLFCTRTAYDLLAAGAIFLFPRLFSLLDNYQNFSSMIISARRMIIDLLIAMIVICACSSGFWVAFTLAFARDVFTADQVAYDLLRIFFGFSPVVWNSWEYYSFIGRGVLLLFMFVCNFLIVTILVAVLSNSFAHVTENAHEEHRYLFAVNTITMIKSESSTLFAYAAPLNLLEWVIRPLDYFVSFRDFLIINRTIIKITHLPILLSIFVYEKTYVRLAVNRENKMNEALTERRKVVEQRHQQLQQQQEQYDAQEAERKKQKTRKNHGPPTTSSSSAATKGSTKPIAGAIASPGSKPSKTKKAVRKALIGGTGENHKVSTSNLLTLNAQMNTMSEHAGEPKVLNKDLLDEVFQRPYEGSIRGRPSFSMANFENPFYPTAVAKPTGDRLGVPGYGSMGSTNGDPQTQRLRRTTSRARVSSVATGDEDFRLRRARSQQRKDSMLSQARYFYNSTNNNRNTDHLTQNYSDPEESMRRFEENMKRWGLNEALEDDDDADSEPDATDICDDSSVNNYNHSTGNQNSNQGINYFSRYRSDGSPVHIPVVDPVATPAGNTFRSARKYSSFSGQPKLDPISSYDDDSSGVRKLAAGDSKAAAMSNRSRASRFNRGVSGKSSSSLRLRKDSDSGTGTVTRRRRSSKRTRRDPDNNGHHSGSSQLQNRFVASPDSIKPTSDANEESPSSGSEKEETGITKNTNKNNPTSALTVPARVQQRSRGFSDASYMIPLSGNDGSGALKPDKGDIQNMMSLSPAVSTTTAFEKYLIQSAKQAKGLKKHGLGSSSSKNKASATALMLDQVDDDYEGDDGDADEDDEDDDEDDAIMGSGSNTSNDEKDLSDNSLSDSVAEEIQSMTRMVLGRMDELESSVKKIEHLLTELAIRGEGGDTRTR